MAAQYDGIAVKAAEIRKTMSELSSKANAKRQKKEDLITGVLPAVETILAEKGEITAEITRLEETAKSALQLTGEDNQPAAKLLISGRLRPVKRISRIF